MRVLGRVSEALGERAYRDALSDSAMKFGLPRLGIFVAQLLSLAVLASPFALAAGALAIASIDFPAPMPLIIAGLLLMLSWFLLPKRSRRRKPEYGRDQLPETFRLVDAIGAKLSSPPIDAIAIDHEFNAYLHERSDWRGRRRRVLGIGMLLWSALPGAERIALIAHELGHATNGDPRRGRIIGGALEVLRRWTVMLDRDMARGTSTDTGFAGLIVELLYAVLHALIDMCQAVLLATTMYRSQIAEYRADASGASVAGRIAMSGLLDRLILWDSTNTFHSFYGTYYRHQKGRELVDCIVGALNDLGGEERRSILERARAERHSVDRTHPPTVFRQEFIEQHSPAPPSLGPEEVDFEAIDRELAKFIEATGNWIAARRDASLQ